MMGTRILGVDSSDAWARAVAIDGAGAILGRASATGANADGSVVAELISRETTAIGFAVEVTVGVGFGIEVEGDAAPEPPRLALCTPGLAAITAEGWVGAARGARHAVCLVIGDRVTAGVLLDGAPWQGAHGRAGDAAWLAINPVERQDYRRHGSLAAEVSSRGIARRVSWRIQSGDPSSVLEAAGDLESITAAHVFEGARSGDGVSIAVVRDTAKYIGMAVANLAVAIDPEVIVIGGLAAAAADLLLEQVRQEYVRRMPPGMADAIRLEMSPLGEDGIAIGAARLAMLAEA